MKRSILLVAAMLGTACGDADFSGADPVDEGGQDVVDGGSDSGPDVPGMDGAVPDAPENADGGSSGVGGSGGSAGQGETGIAGQGGQPAADAGVEVPPRKTCEQAACFTTCQGSCVDAYTCKCSVSFNCNACAPACNTMGTLSHTCSANICLCSF